MLPCNFIDKLCYNAEVPKVVGATHRGPQCHCWRSANGMNESNVTQHNVQCCKCLARNWQKKNGLVEGGLK